ncbi:DoxX family membrane protein [Gordonia jinhuaensis]|uniref:RpiR family transcriptional regulator n=1 Tax=Gordonia jinhuaensis TaxID=1517702 RepID=A0A916T6W4_9ACTN|nr:DoxX family protein [Gordonia jinhuaensis]GGB33078.1 RpiR family transcriptional regulator [Gordonia jinhuaensis]
MARKNKKTGTAASAHTSASARALDAGLLGLRVTVGATLFAHGAQKLAGWFDGPGIEGTAAGMQQMGFEPAKASAVLAGISEAAGGLMVAGVGTRLAAAAGSAAMLAAAQVHRQSGFFAQNGGYEYPAVLGLASASIALTGPGRYALDSVVGRKLNHWGVGVAALGLSLAGSAGVLSQRTKTLAARTAA